MKMLESKRRWLRGFDKRLKSIYLFQIIRISSLKQPGTYDKLKVDEDVIVYLLDIKEVGNLIYNSFERICCEAMKHVPIQMTSSSYYYYYYYTAIDTRFPAIRAQP